MFKSAALKLTAWYLGIIMVLSIGCSFALYRVSINDLDRSSRRQVGFFNQLLGPQDSNDFDSLRSRQLKEDKQHLLDNLFIFNLFVLGIGGGASYMLARRTLEPIELALHSQSRFAADASHELRTPLAAISAENEVALRNPSLTKAEAKQLLASNLEEVGKLKALSEGLLTLAATSNKTNLDQEVSLKEVVEMAVSRLEKAAQNKQLKLNTDLQNSNTKGSPEQLAQLVTILLDNAIKYSPKKGQISLLAGTKDKHPFIRVSDQGKGIASADLPHIFDRFYQADTSRSKADAGGYGLGLAIAKKIADLHHARIDVRSTVNKGSEFTLVLPRI